MSEPDESAGYGSYRSAEVVAADVVARQGRIDSARKVPVEVRVDTSGGATLSNIDVTERKEGE